MPYFCHRVSVILLAVEAGKVDKETATEALSVFAAVSSFFVPCLRLFWSKCGGSID